MIYIVTAGTYSDYGIHAVFTDEELADAYVAAFKSSDDMRIEPMEENPHEVFLKAGCIAFVVKMDIEGNTLLVKRDDDYHLRTYKENYIIQESLWVPGNGPRNERKDILHIEMHVFAKDDKHAVKIVNEKRGQLIASNLFKYEVGKIRT
jgi:hypothetical protein